MFWFHYGVGILIYQPDDYVVCIKNEDLNAVTLVLLLVLLLLSLVLLMVLLLPSQPPSSLSVMSLFISLSGCLLDACLM